MADLKIRGTQHALKEIFSDQFVFEIPPYQRPYSWTTEQAGELIEDLHTGWRQSDDRDPDPYFLGSIVLAKEENDASAKVIDGQQRLTTLTILLSAMAVKAPAEKREKLWEFILQKENEFRGTSNVYRLTLRARDADFFRNYVQSPEGLGELLKKDLAPLNDVERNIRNNSQLFLQRLEELSAAELASFGFYVLNHCVLVAVSTPDRDSAYQIFAILNDRGLDLSHADILKSELIGKIPDEKQDIYTKKWEDAEAALGVEAFGELFTHIRMIYAKSKQRGNLLKEFREFVTTQLDDPRKFVDDVVSPYADIYSHILHRSWESSERAEEINRWLRWLNRIDNFDWIPPAISYLHRHQNQPKQIALFLERLERLAASMFIRRVGINQRIERYGNILQQIEDGEDVLVSGSALDLTEEEKANTLAQLDGEIYASGRPRLYVLLRLDDALSGGGATYDYAVITVEHVLPQTPPQGSEWTELFTEDEREYWTHRVANLVLLSRRKNSSAQNYDFATKKGKYFTGADGTSPFVLTTQVLDKSTWIPELLEKRQRDLVQRFADVWDLRPGGV